MVRALDLGAWLLMAVRATEKGRLCQIAVDMPCYSFNGLSEDFADLKVFLKCGSDTD